MAVIAILLGLLIGVLAESWIPFGVAAVLAIGLLWTENKFLHDHMHNLYAGEEDEHGVKTIE